MNKHHEQLMKALTRAINAAQVRPPPKFITKQRHRNQLRPGFTLPFDAWKQTEDKKPLAGAEL